MKSITLEISAEGGFYPANQLLVAGPSIIREPPYHVTILKDGTIILLYHLQGDLDQVRTYLTDHKEVIPCNVSENGSGFVYIHGRPLKSTREFFFPAWSYEIVFETPIAYTDDGLKIMMSGDEQTLHRVISEIPLDIKPTLLRKRERKPGESAIISLLTECQVEVLTPAVEEGYYEISRGTTHEKAAIQTGVATMTASEHLRKAEQRVSSAFIR